MKGIFLIFLVCLSFGCSSLASRQPLKAVNASSLYNVETFEPIGESLMVKCSVSADVSRKAGGYIGSVSIYIRDDFDCRFAQNYPTAEWIKDNVLRFNSSFSDPSQKASLDIANRTGQSIRFLNFRTSDILLALDIKAHETLTMEVSPTSMTHWASAHAVLADGKVLSDGIDMSLNGSEVPQKICIAIDENELAIVNSTIASCGTHSETSFNSVANGDKY